MKLENVDLLLADQRNHLRSNLRMALADAGFTRIQDASAFTALEESIAQSAMPDIVVCDSDLRGGNMVEFVRSIRQNNIGANPFVCIVATTWNPTPARVQPLIDAGVDFVLGAPVSPKQIIDRVKSLITNRKPFVFTSEYVGSDRRGDGREPSNQPLIRVRNTLRAKALGEFDPKIMTHEIASALKLINDCKLEQAAKDIMALIDLLLRSSLSQNGRLSGEQVEQLLKLTEELERSARRSSMPHVAELCRSVRTVAQQLGEGPAANDDKPVRLIRELIAAIRAAIQPSSNSANVAHDIARTVRRAGLG